MTRRALRRLRRSHRRAHRRQWAVKAAAIPAGPTSVAEIIARALAP